MNENQNQYEKLKFWEIKLEKKHRLMMIIMMMMFFSISLYSHHLSCPGFRLNISNNIVWVYMWIQVLRAVNHSSILCVWLYRIWRRDLSILLFFFPGFDWYTHRKNNFCTVFLAVVNVDSFFLFSCLIENKQNELCKKKLLFWQTRTSSLSFL